ncbi:MAG: hypothetical protein RLZ95_577 [Bacteroidota bacterium]|jgi:hypothetical protein
MTWIGYKPLATLLISLLHPFYVSVIDINHNNKEASIEISVRTFTTDIENRLEKEYNVKLDLSDPKQKAKAETYINLYVQKRLALSANGTKAKMEFVGYEIQKESTWSYFEIKNITQLKQLDVFCEILFGIDPSQINIIHAKTNGQTKSYELAAPKNRTSFTF